MPEQKEGNIPQQEMEKIETPDISSHLSFLKEAIWQYKDMTPETQSNIEQSFRQVFEKLPPKEQKAISLELQALDLQIDSLDKQNKGIAIIRQSEIAGYIRETLERSGLIADAKEDGAKNAKERMTGLAQDTAAYLNEYKTFAQDTKNKAADRDTEENAKYFLIIISGIEQELERLQLANPAKIQPKGELKQEQQSQHIIATRITRFGTSLENSIKNEGLIGFSTLNKLINQFHRAKRYLNDAILIEKTKE